MTATTPPPDQPRKDAAPLPPPSPAETKKGTQPLNPDSGANQKPVSNVDAETKERLQKLLSSRRQSGDSPGAATKTGAAPPSPAPAKPEKKELPAAPPAPSLGRPATSSALVKKEGEGPDSKNASWPEPAQTLGGSSTPGKPDAAPAPGAPPAREAVPPSSGLETARLNQPPAEPAPKSPPEDAGPAGSGLFKRSKADVQAAIRTTSATRNVPKGRVAQEVWKVIFQAATGAEAKELSVEVKGLSVVGRTDPDSDSKADLDLAPFNAGAYGVSRQHVILIPTDEGPCIIDMNSTNGTWINGLYLEPGRRYRLRTNDRVELGSLKLLVRVMTPAESGASAASTGGQAPADTVKKPGGP